MNDIQNAEGRTHPQCFKARLGMSGVFQCERVYVFKSNHSISKIDTVFPLILSRLPGVPLKTRKLIVCTICVQCKAGLFLDLSEVF